MTEYKFPKTVAACADKLWKIRESRLAQQKIADELEKEEKALKAHIIENLPKSEASGISGKIANVAIRMKEVAQVKDWEAFYKYVKKTGSFELLQKRLNDSAILERVENGKPVPGVGSFNVVTLSLTKVK
jgi:hypothetical protein